MAQRVINELDLLCKLGSGVFGEVWRAEMKPHGIVAVKKIRRTVAERLGLSVWTEIRDHLLKEAESLKKAQHRHVVQVHSVHWDESSDHVYIVTELCDSSLADRINDGPLPIGDAFLFMSHILLGLNALHGQGMLHRDVKPSNVLILGADAKLADFGLATDELRNGYGTGISYAPHRAPETFRGGFTSTKTDIWAVGMTAYRMLNGDAWYAREMCRLGVFEEGEGEPDFSALCSPSFAPALTWMPHIPEAWRRFVKKALAFDSARRYTDASAMLTALQGMNLPDDVGWACVHKGQSICWKRVREGGRHELVVWNDWTSIDQSFEILTQSPDGTGRRVLRRGEGGQSQVLSDLSDFFCSRSK